MADSVLDFLLDALKLLISKPKCYVIADIDQIETLYDDLRHVRSFLQELKWDRDDHARRSCFLTQIKEPAQEALEELDSFIDNVVMKDEEYMPVEDTRALNLSLKLGYLADVINSVKTRMAEIKKKLDVPKIEPASAENSLKEVNLLVENHTTLVGIEDDVDKLKEKLLGVRNQLQVISIVGMAGIGKTTLAKYLYNDDFIVYHFYLRAWTCASQEYCKRVILLSILTSTVENKDKIQLMNDENLARELYRNLKGNRYLIVIDDIWSIEAWMDLKILFPDDNNGSRIIVTTRLNDVALNIKPGTAPHFMQLLSKDESWDLLRQKALGEKECPLELIDVGNKIAAKCQGLPLAIVVLARLLARNKSYEAWMEICTSLSLYVGNSQQLMNILALSYDHLPSHLQNCFLYFGAFPEDYEILAFRLIWLWIAEGFISPVKDTEMEKIAEEYLRDLIDRNLIVVSKKNSNGNIKTCSMHDMLRELCFKKAKEMNLLQPIDWYKRVSSPLTPILSNNHCFHSHGFHDFSEKPCEPNIRSLFCYVSEGRNQVQKPIRTSFVYKFLKVLNMWSILLYSFPLEVLQLFHLRFLELWVHKLDKLPVIISNLWNLESLIVTKEEWGGVTIPHSIWKMVKLRHLRIAAELHFEKPRQNADNPNVLNELQTLSAVDLSFSNKDAEEVLARTPNLRKLTFYRGPNKTGKFSFPNLANLMYLKSLKFSENSWEPTHARIPLPHYFPHNLKKVILSGGQLEWTEISKLGMLPCLEILKLRRNCFIGAKWKTREGEFVRLKFLKLSWMDLSRWTTSDSHFPSLERLVLERCKYLEEVPPALGNVATMQMIEVYWCSRSTMDSAKRIQDDQKSMGNDGLKVITYSLDQQGEFSEECPIL